MKSSPHTPITSKDNRVIQQIRALADAKHRRKERAFLIEGVKMVEEALRDDVGVRQLIAAPSLLQHHGRGILKLAESRNVDVVWVAERLLGQLSESKAPQPTMAVVPMREQSLERILNDRARLVVVADRLQDPGNLGTIIRTAEAAAASGIILTPGSVDPYNAKAIRASMGSILRVPVAPCDDAQSLLQACREKGFRIAAAVAAGGICHFDADFTGPIALVFGQEGTGLPTELVNAVTLRVRIPMAETIESLNVASSAAIIMYEAVRQRMKG